MVKKCYPKGTYCSLLAISIILIILIFFLIMFEIKIPFLIEFILNSILYFIACVFFKLGMAYYQSYFIIGDKLILGDGLGEVTEIDLNNATYEVVELKTRFLLFFKLTQTWICVYEKKEQIERFHKGCSNKKNKRRIQVIYSEEFLSELEKREVEKIVE